MFVPSFSKEQCILNVPFGTATVLSLTIIDPLSDRFEIVELAMGIASGSRIVA